MKITIELDPAELAAAFAQLASSLVQHKLPPVYPFSNGGSSVTLAQLDPAGNLEFAQKVDPPLARSGFTYAPVDPPAEPSLVDPVVEYNVGAGVTVAPPNVVVAQLDPVAPPARDADKPSRQRPTVEQRIATRRASGRQVDLAPTDPTRVSQGKRSALSFEEFDALVKSDVKRLSTGRIMPTHSLWNEMRNPALPNLTSVATRYGVATVEELAMMLGYTPPLRGMKPQQSAGEEIQAAEAVSA